MAFLGEKLFAFLFLNGGCAPHSAPLLLMKSPPGSRNLHLIPGENRDRSDEWSAVFWRILLWVRFTDEYGIVNAVTHRDYTNTASVQAMLFADRLELWNPGEPPLALTIPQLRRPHASIPRNPLIADPISWPVTLRRRAAAFSP